MSDFSEGAEPWGNPLRGVRLRFDRPLNLMDSRRDEDSMGFLLSNQPTIATTTTSTTTTTTTTAAAAAAAAAAATELSAGSFFLFVPSMVLH